MKNVTIISKGLPILQVEGFSRELKFSMNSIISKNLQVSSMNTIIHNPWKDFLQNYMYDSFTSCNK